MRNILLTTALATLFTGVASAHSAHVEKTMKDSEGLSVSVGGSFDGQAATRSQKSHILLLLIVRIILTHKELLQVIRTLDLIQLLRFMLQLKTKQLKVLLMVHTLVF